MIGALYLSATDLLDDVRAALAAGPTSCPARRGVTVGLVPWTGQCDQLWVSLGNSWPSNNFPIPASGEPSGQCAAAMLGAELTVALIRCFPTVDSAGAPPTPAALATVTEGIAADIQILDATVACSLATQIDQEILDYSVTGANLVGPDGGRVAIEVPCRVALRRG